METSLCAFCARHFVCVSFCVRTCVLLYVLLTANIKPWFCRSLVLVLLDRETMRLALFSLAGSRHMLTSVHSQPVKPISIRRYTHTQSHARTHTHTLMLDERFTCSSQCMRTHRASLQHLRSYRETLIALKSHISYNDKQTHTHICAISIFQCCMIPVCIYQIWFCTVNS